MIMTGESHRSRHFPHSLDGDLPPQRRIAVLGKMPPDILHDHDGGIHHHAHGKGKAPQTHQVGT